MSRLHTAISLLSTLVVAVACTDSFASPVRHQVGTVRLHNTGSPQAQHDFLDGLAALHSFWYEEARRLFRQAQTTDPGFALA